MKKDYGRLSVELREATGGQVFTGIKGLLSNQDELSTYYSPGIAEPCRVIAENKEMAKKLTIKKNSVAVVSDGSAVLGLGNIGPEAALPVMEGKCMLLKHFADIDGVPIVLNTQDVDKIVDTVVRIAPTFGGINLEDIAAPRCFEIQAKLAQKLDIPVFHDDQDGTAIVTLAALTNALKIQGKKKEDVRIVLSGAGAAGIAIARLLKADGYMNIDLVDSRGIVNCAREDLNDSKKEYCTWTEGTLETALVGADVFVGVSKGGLLTRAMVERMNEKPIIFAMANPIPEIMPAEIENIDDIIIGTGRSDYSNQINNVLIFPGFFRGLLDNGIVQITEKMKLNAAKALATMVESPTHHKIIPGPFDQGVAEKVAKSLETL